MTADRCGGRTTYASPHFAPAASFVEPVGTSIPSGANSPVGQVAAREQRAESVIPRSTVGDSVVAPAEPAPATKPRPWLIRHWQLPLAIVMLALAFLTLHDHLPSMTAMGRAIGSANVVWIVVAAGCEVISLGMFARQQRTLLAAVGVRMSMARATAVTYARSALAISMPAGSAVSAGFAFSQYRRSGATNDRAAAVMVLSGLTSILGLAMLYVVMIFGLLVATPSQTISQHPALVGTIGGALAVIALVWFIRRRTSASRGPVKRSDELTVTGGRLDRIRLTIRQTIDAWRSLRRRDWSSAGAFAIANWLADLLCLAAAARAFALPVGLFTIATMYLGIQIIRQLPITPGGIGLIETGLLAGLTHAGAGAGAAAAVVLTYRMLSCWLIIPLGGVAWLALRTGPKAAATGPAKDLVLASGEAGQLTQ